MDLSWITGNSPIVSLSFPGCPVMWRLSSSSSSDCPCKMLFFFSSSYFFSLFTNVFGHLASSSHRFYSPIRDRSADFRPIRASITRSFDGRPSERRTDSSHRQFLSFNLLCRTTRFRARESWKRVWKYISFMLLKLRSRIAREIAFFELVMNGVSSVSAHHDRTTGCTSSFLVPRADSVTT
jgi:hypothetical protein